MSGHSRWHGIKHKKMAMDAQKGKIFTKVIREITVAVREGGDNPDNNPRLRRAIESAKAVNMPYENIKRAIMRGTGELPGATYEDVTYEGYGPGGVAVLVEATTENKNRLTAEIRKIFSQYNGTLGESGCVSWIFLQKGYISVDKSTISEDEITSIALELNVEDLKTDDPEVYELITSTKDFEVVKKELMDRNIKIVQAEITMIPKTYVKLTGKEAEQMLHLMNALENHDDVKNVCANFDIPKEIMEKIEISG